MKTATLTLSYREIDLIREALFEASINSPEIEPELKELYYKLTSALCTQQHTDERSE